MILAAFAYAISRSGKTVYYSPIIVLGPGKLKDHTLVQSFLIWPREYDPAVLNPATEVWNSRLSDIENVPWERLEAMGSPRELFEQFIL